MALRHDYLTLASERFALAFLQQRLWIERVDMADTAVAEDRDDRLRFAGKMRRPRGERGRQIDVAADTR